MQVTEFKATPLRPAQREAAEGHVDKPAQSRAVVALAPRSGHRHETDRYHQAAFLAHLLATKDQLPQTRERRRAEPDEALAAYRATPPAW